MDMMFGTKVYDTKKKQIAIVIKTYKLGYIDNPEAMGAYVLSADGSRYPQNLDNLRLISDFDEAEIKQYNIPECFLID